MNKIDNKVVADNKDDMVAHNNLAVRNMVDNTDYIRDDNGDSIPDVVDTEDVNIDGDIVLEHYQSSLNKQSHLQLNSS